MRRIVLGASLSIIAATIVVMLFFGGSAQAMAHHYNPAPESLVRAALREQAPPRGTVGRKAWAVCQYWRGRRCRPALNVAWCEGGLNVRAVTGQYWGTFQMSADNRRRYGHAWNIWKQAEFARHLWNDRHWSPWDCSPVPLK